MPKHIVSDISGSPRGSRGLIISLCLGSLGCTGKPIIKLFLRGLIRRFEANLFTDKASLCLVPRSVKAMDALTHKLLQISTDVRQIPSSTDTFIMMPVHVV